MDTSDITTLTMKAILGAVMLAHSWYPISCCSNKDCHPVPCEEVNWLQQFNPKVTVLSSQDSECHACTTHAGRVPICLFKPEVIS
jgi:hypothetical protein